MCADAESCRARHSGCLHARRLHGPRAWYRCGTPPAAGWRRGYAPDCKAPHVPREINTLGENCCQDKSGTSGEHDNDGLTVASRDLTKRERGPIAASRHAERRIREERATSLAYAIRDAHPDDARQLLVAALIDLSAGIPPYHPFGDMREDARWWASSATPSELQEYLAAALRELGGKALCRTMRKQLFVALWQAFPESDRLAFLARVDPQGKFTGSAA